ncbi:hypothetical protein J0X14_06680 [Muricauda sp. CAU 1633]|uniref:DUF6326 family protein n=1 Tax=Allomuricauda sp. CAU 1633 TaxID=2816036 RepID=UPI001A8C9766|nr:DUF6326 family protein [Muricauda sp. CAU 1633]MBO0321974.1 hypothetical protein [Muricauda sp. CAU 1633]
MSIKKESPNSLTDYGINVKIKLASLWTTLMFLYIYADYFRLMTPGKLEHMIKLQSPMGPTSPGILVIFSVLLIIPALMIFLSIFLKPQINKWLNIIIALIYACISILIIVSSINKEWQTFFVIFNFVEILVFAMIISQACKWSRKEN